MSQTKCCYASHILRSIDDGIGLLKKLSNSTDPAWEFIYTPKLAVYVGHFVSSCAFFLFSQPKIGRNLMSLGCPYYNHRICAMAELVSGLVSAWTA